MTLLNKRYIQKNKFKLPQNSKLVYEGKLFRIYHYPQKLENNKTAIFELAKRQDNVQILLIYNNKIILAKETQPQFKKPLIGPAGGNANWEEDPEQGAIRETFEETGIKVNKIQLFANDSIDLQKFCRNFYLYIGWGNEIISKPQNTSLEKIELLELTFEEFIKETQKENFRNPKLKQIVKEIINNNELKEFKKLLRL